MYPEVGGQADVVLSSSSERRKNSLFSLLVVDCGRHAFGRGSPTSERQSHASFG